MKRLKKLDQAGVLNALLIPFIMIMVFFLAAAGFATWAFMSRQDYKNNSDSKVTKAVDVAKQQTSTQKDNEFVQKEKEPLKDYKGPEAYGSLDVKYPKTWGAYISEGKNSAMPIDGYFNPDFVPGIADGTIYALRVQVVSNTYASQLQQFSVLAKSGKVQVAPFKAAKVPSIVGSRIDGEIVIGKQGSMIILPIRDKTLKIYTEANQFKGDFNNIILPNFTFTP